MSVAIDEFGRHRAKGWYGFGGNWWSHRDVSARPLDVLSLIDRVGKHDPFAGIIQKIKF